MADHLDSPVIVHYIPCDKSLNTLPRAKLVMVHPNLTRAFLRLYGNHSIEFHPRILLLSSFQGFLVILQERLTELGIHGCLHSQQVPLKTRRRRYNVQVKKNPGASCGKISSDCSRNAHPDRNPNELKPCIGVTRTRGHGADCGAREIATERQQLKHAFKAHQCDPCTTNLHKQSQDPGNRNLELGQKALSMESPDCSWR